ncbi:MAG: HDOD domain-containing protein [Thermoanaerobacteraceae bacterium]|nr:HDOD domain-containing protein [Thermoanaerobacteraceae bacterium]
MNVFVARQPIFNRRKKVVGYELLFRSGNDNFYNKAKGMNDDQATAGVIINSYLLIGFDELTGNKRAFINFTENLLKKEVATILPKEQVAIEILEKVQPSKDLFSVCKKLKEMGYLLVLDDFFLRPYLEPFVRLVDMVKVDFLTTGPQERKEVVENLRDVDVSFLAEKVETVEEFEEALGLGFSYFQGYFFSKPVIVSAQNVPGYKLNYLRLLQEVNQLDIDFNEIEQIIKRDLSLSYKVLTYVNSAAFGFCREICSVKQAVVMLGANELKKLLSVIALGYLGEDKPDELYGLSMIRARFAELLAPKTGNGNLAGGFFLTGLFSLIDAILDRPLEVILEKLCLPKKAKEALLGESNDFRAVLDLVIAYEKGSWEQVSLLAGKLGINECEILDCYLEAVTWTEQLRRQVNQHKKLL